MYNIDGKYISIEGVVDKNIATLFEDKNYYKENFYYIEMDKVTDVTSDGMHALINENEKGYKFVLVKCKKELANKLYIAGLNNFINIIEDPVRIDLSKYKEFGGGFWGSSYRNEDETEMLKVYGKPGKDGYEAVYNEKSASLTLMRMKLISPLSGNLVETEKGPGILYENFKNKISYSRLIERDKDDILKLKVHAKHMSDVLKKISTTEADTKMLRNVKNIYLKYAREIKELPEDVRKKMYDVILEIEDATTCVHGDFQIGNVISADDQDIIIDLPEFSYGSHYFDLATMYLICNTLPEDMAQDLYHNDTKTLKTFWDLFIVEYLGTDDKNIIEKEMKTIYKFACIRTMKYVMETNGLPHLVKRVVDFANTID